jgi:predicted Zn-dependent protease
LLKEIDQLGGSRAWDYRNPPNLVALGRAALLMGADPKLVLENFFEQAKRADPEYRESYLAMADLALRKHDPDLAAKMLREGLKKFPKDPEFLCGLARAFAEDDRGEMLESLAASKPAQPSLIQQLVTI